MNVSIRSLWSGSALILLASCGPLSQPPPAGEASTDGEQTQAAPNAVPAIDDRPLPAFAVEGRAHLLEMRRAKSAPLAEDLRVVRAFEDDLAMRHVRVRQELNGIPVLGGDAVAHFNSDGSLFAITDDTLDGLDVDTHPVITAEEAIAAALRAHGCAECSIAAPTAALMVMRHDKRDHLAYRVQLDVQDPVAGHQRPAIFIDAHGAGEIWRYDDLPKGFGPTLYSGTRSFGTLRYTTDVWGTLTTSYYLQDTTRALTVRNNSSNLPADSDDNWTNYARTDDVDAYWGMQRTYDYYAGVFGRAGINGANGPGTTPATDKSKMLFTARTSYNFMWQNAEWDPGTNEVHFGAGDGSNTGPWVALDVVGHEMTHGLTQFTAGLIYSGDSGALNESFSDVFGAMVERSVKGESANTWRIAEEIFLPGSTRHELRRMDNPSAVRDPDHYSLRINTTADNGGVHTNSSIANYAFYLLAKGGTHRFGGAMTGIGADAAALIWYTALTGGYITSSTGFGGARNGTLNAANAIYGRGSRQANAVATAWHLVGLGDSGTERVFNGSFDGLSTGWILSGGATVVKSGSLYEGYLKMGGGTLVSDAAYQDVTIPLNSDAINLTFLVKVESSESVFDGARDFLRLEIRDTANNLLQTVTTVDNTFLGLGANNGFSVRGSYSLGAYRGRTIRIRLASSNTKAYATTFKIDDVSIQ